MLKYLLASLLSVGILCAATPLNSQTVENPKDSLRLVLQNVAGSDRLEPLLAWLSLPGSGSNPDNYPLALEALSLSHKSDSIGPSAKAHSALATQHFYKGNFDSSKFHQKQALAIYQQVEDSLGMAQVMNGLGVLLDVHGEVDSALSYYLRALEIRQNKDDQMGISSTLNNIAVLFQYQKDYEKALGYFEQCLAIDTKIGNESNLATTYSNIGTTHSNLGNFDLAVDFHKKSLALRRKTDNEMNVSKSLNNLAMAYEKIGQLKTAARFYEDALAIKRNAGNFYEIAQTLANLGPLYLSQKQSDKAIGVLEEAIQLVDTTNLLPLRVRIHRNLAEAFAAQENYVAAFRESQKTDSLESVQQMKEKEKNMDKMTAKFEALEREHEIETLKFQHNLNEEKVASYQTRTRFLWTSLALIGAFSMLLFTLLFKNRRINRELKAANGQLAEKNKEVALKGQAIKEQSDLLSLKNEEILEVNSNLEVKVAERTQNLMQSNLELDTFLYQTSHALRAPLMRVSGLFSILKAETNPEDVVKMQGLIDDTIQGMDQMLFKLLEVQESKLRTPDPIRLDMTQLIEEVLEDLVPTFGRPERLILDLPQKKLGIPDRFLFRVILTNLFENALQFRRDEVELELSVAISVLPKAVLIQVRDNGIGIPEQELEHIFDMFFRATHKSKGTGLGLYVVQKIVEKLGGSTRIESQKGVYTQVEVSLPRMPEAISV